ncbi:acyltransferase family protein [Mangrovimicrobium sediminis]|nr:acyltransferase family protein [Haliea sp. SAOS-164]
MSDSVKYRPEIDGLRAVAVIPVMLFHAGLGPFPGGYVGVDIFFVISGFLMTAIIYREIAGRKFSYSGFYERRARRILPALYTILFAAILPAWFLLIPADFVDFGQNLIGVVGFFSNLTLWMQSDYFDQAAELKPLLHTWSLAVEEQYYLVIPVLLMALYKFAQRWILHLVLLLLAGSLAISHWGAYHKPTATYYLLPTRAWELLTGSVVALLYARRDWPHSLRWIARHNGSLSLLGLLLTAIPIFAYDKHTPFPGLWAAVPVLGTALLIACAQPGTLAYRLLSNRWFVGIGLISYSAYLWHQPVYAFARQQTLWRESGALMFGAFAVSLGLAYLSWRFVEQPFRNRARISNRTVWLVSAGGAVILAAFGWLAIRSDGFEGRFELRQPLTSATFDLPARANGWCFYSVDTNTALEVGEAGLQCKLGAQDGASDILLFGDSFAGMYEPFWDTLGKELSHGVDVITTNWCHPSFTESFWWPNPTRAREQCLQNRAYVADHLDQYRVVVISAVWSMLEQKGLMHEVHELVSVLAGEHGIQVIIMAQPPALTRPSVLRAVYRYGTPQASADEPLAEKANFALRKLAAGNERVYFLDRESLFADDTTCGQVLSADGVPYSWDGGHISIYGSQAAARNVLRSDAMAELASFIEGNP